MYKLEVLVATMNQTDNIALLQKMNIKSDVLVINQSQVNEYKEFNINKHKVRIVSNTQRGLSKSRNQALLLAEGDICLIADDDIKYTEEYNEKVIKAFEEIPDADIIVFDNTLTNYSRGLTTKEIRKIRRAPKYKNYGSVRIAFKRESFLKHNIWFNILFGAGSLFGSGEESLVLRAANKKGLKIYEYPFNIAEVDYSESTWFEGYNGKYFYDKGAFLAAAYPKVKGLFKYYYLMRLSKHSSLDKKSILKYIEKGFEGYKKVITYEQFMKENNNEIS